MSQLTAKIPASDVQHRERKAQLIWTGFILAFFVLQAILWAVAITITSNDPSHAILPSYNEPSMSWRDEYALQHENQKLGWKIDLDVRAQGNVPANQTVILTLLDRDDQPLDGGRVELTAFHRARAGRPQQIAMAADGEGRYMGQLGVRKTGSWKFNGKIELNGETYVIEETMMLETAIQHTRPSRPAGEQ